MADKINLVCPIRGQLSNSGRSADGLTRNEEFFRVEAIRFLIAHDYPKENFRIEVVERRFGNGGRNSFRCDFVVLDCPSADVSKSPDDVLAHAVLLCEVKRDRSRSEYVTKTQVEPMLDFAKRTDAVGLYWAGNEQRLFWHEYVNGVKEVREAPITSLPQFGLSVAIKPLTYATISPTNSLEDIFSHIDNILHGASMDKERRYEVLFQLLLAKIFDEHEYETRGNEPLKMQDFSALGLSGTQALQRISNVVSRAVTYYQNHLPNKIPKKLNVRESDILEIMKVLAPIKITASKRDVVQTFYMKFAKNLYKWDMAQYFTPTAISDFVIDVLNPQFGEHVCDPACGSADFLVGAFRYGRRYNPGYADCVWGYDNSDNAVQVAVLNMVLNGDGKTKIKKSDSLESISEHENRFDIVVCNPPFGKKIVERRSSVLEKFDLAHELSFEMGVMTKGDVLSEQETGVLFIEACVKMSRPEKGRIAIVLPNGYLGNRSDKFLTLRHWLFRHVRIAAIVSLPRFAFKTSGADVSTSIVFMERLEKPLDELPKQSNPIAFEMVERLGWKAGEKGNKPTYVRNEADGALILKDGEPQIESDYKKTLLDILNSEAAKVFPWLLAGRDSLRASCDGWSVPSGRIVQDEVLSLDPKYYSLKNQMHLEYIGSMPHKRLSELVDFIPERQSREGVRISVDTAVTYEYVEIRYIQDGRYASASMKGWELPDRAKHFAEPGDIFFGSIWGSVQKWCVVPSDASNLVVTNGCFRCHMKPEADDLFPDLIAYMTTESWASQLRALCTGSDGLAEIPQSVIGNTLIPLLSEEARRVLQPMADRLKAGRSTIGSELALLSKRGVTNVVEIEKRPSHINLV